MVIQNHPTHFFLSLVFHRLDNFQLNNKGYKSFNEFLEDMEIFQNSVNEVFGKNFRISKLDDFVEKCDVIVHLAGVNRHPSSEYVFNKNIELAEKISNSIKRSKKKIHLIFSSSSQEDLKNEYGRAKKKSREEFIKLSQNSNLSFSGLIIPNVFGPFCKPNYNSFISTFSQSIIFTLYFWQIFFSWSFTNIMK